MSYVKFNNGQITKQSTSEDTDNSAITQKILNISEKISVISEKVSDISRKLSNPVISGVLWNDYVHKDTRKYILTILAHDPNNENLTYEVISNNKDVIITQDPNSSNHNTFTIEYPDWSEDTTVTYTIKVTNESGLEDIVYDTKIVSNSHGERGVFGGGYDGSNYLNTIDYITISILGDAQDFGDLMVSKRAFTATSDA
jgi:hypothetical protein